MPRTGRLHIAGGYYHVMGRGLERRRILNDEEDKVDFLKRLTIGLEESGVACLAWSLMPNHYHLLLRVSENPLSQLMRKLLGGYARQYNYRHRRVGYVFQNRYKSILCDKDSYFLELVRYIHLNPLRAKLVKSLSALDSYHWTGHAGVMGNASQPWLSIDAVLKHFGKHPIKSRQHYRRFIEEGLTKREDTDLSGGGLIRSYGGWEALMRSRQEHKTRIGDERILGDSDFVQEILNDDELVMDEKTRLAQSGWDLEKLIGHICQTYGVDSNTITQRGRANQRSLARSLICYLGMQRLGLSSTELSTRLKMSQPAVSKAAQRGYLQCNKEELEFVLD